MAHDSRPLAAPGDATGRPDYLLLGSVVALLAISALMVYSSSFVVAHNEFGDALYFLSRHLVGIGLGSIVLLVAMRMDYRNWRRLSLLVMLATIGLLILVLVPGVGSNSYGAVRWIKVGPFFQLQPSEIAKVALVLYLADWLARRRGMVGHFGNGLLPFVIIVVIVAGLIELQPDLGTTSIVVGAAACVFFIAGANLLHVGMLAGLGVLGGIAMIARLSGYRQDRIAAFLDPWSDVQGHGWHTAQTLIALGSGGLTGMGLGGSHQKYYWVPNAHTDAIYAIIGEEMGFLGTVLVLGLFGIFTWRGFLIAWRAPDTFGRLLAAGLTCLITLQAVINIAVVTNSIPFTGVTLPLVSYGNSSTVVSMAAVGMLLSISRRRGPFVEEPVAAEIARPRDDTRGEERRSRPRARAAVYPTFTGALSANRQQRGAFTPLLAQARPIRQRAHLRQRASRPGYRGRQRGD